MVLYNDENPPVSVSVVVLFVWWWWAAFYPEFPGLECLPLKSSYTVYTKQCMYKIEKSAEERSVGKSKSKITIPSEQTTNVSTV